MKKMAVSRMTIYWVDCQADDCDNTTAEDKMVGGELQWDDCKAETLDQAREHAKGCGWEVIGGLTLCPMCARKLKEDLRADEHHERQKEARS